MCWPIVCPTFGAFLDFQKCCIYGTVCSLLPTLTYTQWCFWLHVVRLITQGTSGSPVTQHRGINLVTLWMILRVRPKSKLRMGGKYVIGSSWCHVGCSWWPIWGVPGAFICLEMVGVQLVAFGVKFDNYSGLWFPVLLQLVSLGINI